MKAAYLSEPEAGGKLPRGVEAHRAAMKPLEAPDTTQTAIDAETPPRSVPPY